MSRLQSIIITLIFFLTSSFLLGLAFLFLVNVPIEALLANLKISQRTINLIMIIVIIIWAALSITLTSIFYRRICIDLRVPLYAKWLILSFLILGSIGAFYLLITTQSSLIPFAQVSQPGDRFTYGPYPDEKKIQELKDQNYAGIITLLSPTIPFEKVLLDKEQTAAKNVGLEIYSVPMLPWISGNQESLDQLRDLAASDQGPFYVHCYLGQHRVDLAQEIIDQSSGQLTALEVFIEPDHLERGRLTYYRDSQIILGPFPTRDEWFNLVVRGQVQEVISLLDPNDPDHQTRVEEEKTTLTEMNILYTSIPVLTPSPEDPGLQKLTQYLDQLDHKTFIHEFDLDEKTALVDSYLLNQALANPADPFPDQINKQPITKVNLGLALGPPPDQQFSSLPNLQITDIKTLFPELTPLSPIVQADQILSFVNRQTTNHYLTGFASNQESAEVGQILKTRYYGYFEDNLPSPSLPDTPAHPAHNLLVGPLPDQNGLAELANLGVKTIIFLQGRDNAYNGQINALQENVKAQNINYLVIEYNSGYLNKVARQTTLDQNPCYLIVSPAAQFQTLNDINSVTL